MHIKQPLKAMGVWSIAVNGVERAARNLVVNVGLDAAVDLLLNSITPTGAAVSQIAVGSDGTPVTPADTALLAELTRAAVATFAAGGVGVATVSTTFTGITGNVAEAGAFFPSGTMFNRVVFGAIPVVPADNIKVTFTLTLSNVTV